MAEGDGVGGAREAEDGIGNDAPEAGRDEEAQGRGEERGETEVDERADEMRAELRHIALEVERADHPPFQRDGLGELQDLADEAATMVSRDLGEGRAVK